MEAAFDVLNCGGRVEMNEGMSNCLSTHPDVTAGISSAVAGDATISSTDRQMAASPSADAGANPFLTKVQSAEDAALFSAYKSVASGAGEDSATTGNHRNDHSTRPFPPQLPVQQQLLQGNDDFLFRESQVRCMVEEEQQQQHRFAMRQHEQHTGVQRQRQEMQSQQQFHMLPPQVSIQSRGHLLLQEQLAGVQQQQMILGQQQHDTDMLQQQQRTGESEDTQPVHQQQRQPLESNVAYHSQLSPPGEKVDLLQQHQFLQQNEFYEQQVVADQQQQSDTLLLCQSQQSRTEVPSSPWNSAGTAAAVCPPPAAEPPPAGPAVGQLGVRDALRKSFYSDTNSPYTVDATRREGIYPEPVSAADVTEATASARPTALSGGTTATLACGHFPPFSFHASADGRQSAYGPAVAAQRSSTTSPAPPPNAPAAFSFPYAPQLLLQQPSNAFAQMALAAAAAAQQQHHHHQPQQHQSQQEYGLPGNRGTGLPSSPSYGATQSPLPSSTSEFSGGADATCSASAITPSPSVFRPPSAAVGQVSAHPVSEFIRTAAAPSCSLSDGAAGASATSESNETYAHVSWPTGAYSQLSGWAAPSSPASSGFEPSYPFPGIPPNTELASQMQPAARTEAATAAGLPLHGTAFATAIPAEMTTAGVCVVRTAAATSTEGTAASSAEGDVAEGPRAPASAGAASLPSGPAPVQEDGDRTLSVLEGVGDAAAASAEMGETEDNLSDYSIASSSLSEKSVWPPAASGASGAALSSVPPGAVCADAQRLRTRVTVDAVNADGRLMLEQLDVLRSGASKDLYRKERTRVVEELIRQAVLYPKVSGIYFDKHQLRWSVGWAQHGRRVAKYFPVKIFGLAEGYRLAVHFKQVTNAAAASGNLCAAAAFVEGAAAATLSAATPCGAAVYQPKGVGAPVAPGQPLCAAASTGAAAAAATATMPAMMAGQGLQQRLDAAPPASAAGAAAAIPARPSSSAAAAAGLPVGREQQHCMPSVTRDGTLLRHQLQQLPLSARALLFKQQQLLLLQELQQKQQLQQHAAHQLLYDSSTGTENIQVPLTAQGEGAAARTERNNFVPPAAGSDAPQQHPETTLHPTAPSALSSSLCSSSTDKGDFNMQTVASTAAAAYTAAATSAVMMQAASTLLLQQQHQQYNPLCASGAPPPSLALQVDHRSSEASSTESVFPSSLSQQLHQVQQLQRQQYEQQQQPQVNGEQQRQGQQHEKKKKKKREQRDQQQQGQEQPCLPEGRFCQQQHIAACFAGNDGGELAAEQLLPPSSERTATPTAVRARFAPEEEAAGSLTEIEKCCVPANQSLFPTSASVCAPAEVGRHVVEAEETAPTRAAAARLACAMPLGVQCAGLHADPPPQDLAFEKGGIATAAVAAGGASYYVSNASTTAAEQLSTTQVDCSSGATGASMPVGNMPITIQRSADITSQEEASALTKHLAEEVVAAEDRGRHAARSDAAATASATVQAAAGQAATVEGTAMDEALRGQHQRCRRNNSLQEDASPSNSTAASCRSSISNASKIERGMQGIHHDAEDAGERIHANASKAAVGDEDCGRLKGDISAAVATKYSDEASMSAGRQPFSRHNASSGAHTCGTGGCSSARATYWNSDGDDSSGEDKNYGNNSVKKSREENKNSEVRGSKCYNASFNNQKNKEPLFQQQQQRVEEESTQAESGEELDHRASSSSSLTEGAAVHTLLFPASSLRIKNLPAAKVQQQNEHPQAAEEHQHAQQQQGDMYGEKHAKDSGNKKACRGTSGDNRVQSSSRGRTVGTISISCGAGNDVDSRGSDSNSSDSASSNTSRGSSSDGVEGSAKDVVEKDSSSLLKQQEKATSAADFDATSSPPPGWQLESRQYVVNPGQRHKKQQSEHSQEGGVAAKQCGLYPAAVTPSEGIPSVAVAPPVAIGTAIGAAALLTTVAPAPARLAGEAQTGELDVGGAHAEKRAGGQSEQEFLRCTHDEQLSPQKANRELSNPRRNRSRDNRSGSSSGRRSSDSTGNIGTSSIQESDSQRNKLVCVFSNAGEPAAALEGKGATRDTAIDRDEREAAIKEGAAKGSAGGSLGAALTEFRCKSKPGADVLENGEALVAAADGGRKKPQVAIMRSNGEASLHQDDLAKEKARVVRRGDEDGDVTGRETGCGSKRRYTEVGMVADASTDAATSFPAEPPSIPARSLNESSAAAQAVSDKREVARAATANVSAEEAEDRKSVFIRRQCTRCCMEENEDTKQRCEREEQRNAMEDSGDRSSTCTQPEEATATNKTAAAAASPNAATATTKASVQGALSRRKERAGASTQQKVEHKEESFTVSDNCRGSASATETATGCAVVADIIKSSKCISEEEENGTTRIVFTGGASVEDERSRGAVAAASAGAGRHRYTKTASTTDASTRQPRTGEENNQGREKQILLDEGREMEGEDPSKGEGVASPYAAARGLQEKKHLNGKQARSEMCAAADCHSTVPPGSKAIPVPSAVTGSCPAGDQRVEALNDAVQQTAKTGFTGPSSVLQSAAAGPCLHSSDFLPIHFSAEGLSMGAPCAPSTSVSATTTMAASPSSNPAAGSPSFSSSPPATAAPTGAVTACPTVGVHDVDDVIPSVRQSSHAELSAASDESVSAAPKYVGMCAAATANSVTTADEARKGCTFSSDGQLSAQVPSEPANTVSSSHSSTTCDTQFSFFSSNALSASVSSFSSSSPSPLPCDSSLVSSASSAAPSPSSGSNVSLHLTAAHQCGAATPVFPLGKDGATAAAPATSVCGAVPGTRLLPASTASTTTAVASSVRSLCAPKLQPPGIACASSPTDGATSPTFRACEEAPGGIGHHEFKRHCSDLRSTSSNTVSNVTTHDQSRDDKGIFVKRPCVAGGAHSTKVTSDTATGFSTAALHAAKASRFLLQSKEAHDACLLSSQSPGSPAVSPTVERSPASLHTAGALTYTNSAFGPPAAVLQPEVATATLLTSATHPAVTGVGATNQRATVTCASSAGATYEQEGPALIAAAVRNGFEHSSETLGASVAAPKNTVAFPASGRRGIAGAKCPPVAALDGRDASPHPPVLGEAASNRSAGPSEAVIQPACSICLFSRPPSCRRGDSGATEDTASTPSARTSIRSCTRSSKTGSSSTSPCSRRNAEEVGNSGNSRRCRRSSTCMHATATEVDSCPSLAAAAAALSFGAAAAASGVLRGTGSPTYIPVFPPGTSVGPFCGEHARLDLCPVVAENCAPAQISCVAGTATHCNTAVGASRQTAAALQSAADSPHPPAVSVSYSTGSSAAAALSLSPYTAATTQKHRPAGNSCAPRSSSSCCGTPQAKNAAAEPSTGNAETTDAVEKEAAAQDREKALLNGAGASAAPLKATTVEAGQYGCMRTWAAAATKSFPLSSTTGSQKSRRPPLASSRDKSFPEAGVAPGIEAAIGGTGETARKEDVSEVAAAVERQYEDSPQRPAAPLDGSYAVSCLSQQMPKHVQSLMSTSNCSCLQGFGHHEEHSAAALAVAAPPPPPAVTVSATSRRVAGPRASVSAQATEEVPDPKAHEESNTGGSDARQRMNGAAYPNSASTTATGVAAAATQPAAERALAAERATGPAAAAKKKRRRGTAADVSATTAEAAANASAADVAAAVGEDPQESNSSKHPGARAADLGAQAAGAATSYLCNSEKTHLTSPAAGGTAAADPCTAHPAATGVSNGGGSSISTVITTRSTSVSLPLCPLSSPASPSPPQAAAPPTYLHTTGIHFDKHSLRWKATWYNSSGQRKAKYFPVAAALRHIGKHGYEEARRLAILARHENHVPRSSRFAAAHAQQHSHLQQHLRQQPQQMMVSSSTYHRHVKQQADGGIAGVECCPPAASGTEAFLGAAAAAATPPLTQQRHFPVTGSTSSSNVVSFQAAAGVATSAGVQRFLADQEELMQQPQQLHLQQKQQLHFQTQLQQARLLQSQTLQQHMQPPQDLQRTYLWHPQQQQQQHLRRQCLPLSFAASNTAPQPPQQVVQQGEQHVLQPVHQYSRQVHTCWQQQQQHSTARHLLQQGEELRKEQQLQGGTQHQHEATQQHQDAHEQQKQQHEEPHPLEKQDSYVEGERHQNGVLLQAADSFAFDDYPASLPQRPGLPVPGGDVPGYVAAAYSPRVTSFAAAQGVFGAFDSMPRCPNVPPHAPGMNPSFAKRVATINGSAAASLSSACVFSMSSDESSSAPTPLVLCNHHLPRDPHHLKASAVEGEDGGPTAAAALVRERQHLMPLVALDDRASLTAAEQPAYSNCGGRSYSRNSNGHYSGSAPARYNTGIYNGSETYVSNKNSSSDVNAEAAHVSASTTPTTKPAAAAPADTTAGRTFVAATDTADTKKQD